MKVCTKCGESKPLSEYHKKKWNKDGHESACKVCRKAANKAYREANRERILASDKAYRERVAAERVEPSPTDTKTCTKCNEAKPLTEYHRQTKSRDGHTPQCKVCALAQQKAYHERIAAERVEPAPTDTKTCTGCGVERPYADYYRNPSSRDGRSTRCKVCTLAKQAEYRERVAAERVEPSPTDTRTCTKCGEAKPLTDFHKMSASPDGRAYYCKSCVKAEKKAYYAANREKRNAYNKAYHAKRWANDPEYRAQSAAAALRRRRLLDSAVQEHYTRKEIFERDGWTCQLCQEPIDSDLKYPDSGYASIDHIIPLSHGGDDTPANVQAAHFGCNSGKSNRVELEDQAMLTGVAG